MINLEETQNYLKLSCTQCDLETIEEIKMILDDLNITKGNMRSCVFSLWKDVSYDSDGSYRFVRDFEVDDFSEDWEILLKEALVEAEKYSNSEISGKILFKKPDPMKAIVDNVNLNLSTLNGKIKEL